MVTSQPTADAEGNVVAWGWFLGWLAVGACAGTGLAAILSFGIVLVLLAAVAAGVLLWRSPRRTIVGLLAGPAVPLVYIAYLNRGGPGNVCRAAAGGQTCVDEYAPVPFLVGAAVFSCAGVLMFIALRHRAGKIG
ncbi:hypothetical protein [Streptomyces sp. NPDC058291]|jgi:hypothetical protein|uniref:hypothetical protein n=1 Tax=Streptomyces sp. NPDC058291 TaxID=3346427 RepID=UPI0036E43CA5